MKELLRTVFDTEPLDPGDVALRIVLAVILGGLVGLERGIRNHPAGFRTHILVCVGACVAMLTNEFVFDAVGAAGTDPTRIGAQVVSGIGFLGVGTIFMAGRNTVRGLTTAAGLWASGTIGLATGIGFYLAAIICTATVFVVLGIFPSLENVLYSSSRRMRLHIECESLEAEQALAEFIETCGRTIRSKYISSIDNHNHRVTSHFSIKIDKNTDTDNFVSELSRKPGVLLVEVM